MGPQRAHGNLPGFNCLSSTSRRLAPAAPVPVSTTTTLSLPMMAKQNGAWPKGSASTSLNKQGESREMQNGPSKTEASPAPAKVELALAILWRKNKVPRGAGAEWESRQHAPPGCTLGQRREFSTTAALQPDGSPLASASPLDQSARSALAFEPGGRARSSRWWRKHPTGPLLSRPKDGGHAGACSNRSISGVASHGRSRAGQARGSTQAASSVILVSAGQATA